MQTKVIYSLRLMQFLVNNDCELIEILQHPHIKNFKCWKFEDNQHLQDCIAKFMEKERQS